MTYPEYLKSLGATDEDIKVLDHPIGRKAWEAATAQVTQATEEAAAAKQSKKDFEARNVEWYDTTLAEYTRMQQETVKAKADRARAVELVKSATDAGLLEIAKGMGFDDPPPPNTNTPPPNGFDPTKYFTKEDVIEIARKESYAIATVNDISNEHARLFPGQPLRMRELLQEAQTRKIPVEKVWEEKFKVPEVRARVESETRTAYEKKLREEGAATAREEFASKYGNPETRPLVPSTSPFSQRPESIRGKQPWETPEATLESDRVRRVSKLVLDKQLTN